MDKFKDSRNNWPDWLFAFRAFSGRVDSKAVECLLWAAGHTDSIMDEVVDLENNSVLICNMNGHMYTMLSLLVQGEALDKFG